MAGRHDCAASTLALLTAAGYLPLGAVGCLPRDTRPEPAEIYVTADLPTALRDQQSTDGTLGFVTDDGWTITIDSLYVSIGHAGFDGDSCNEYADAGYRRVLNALGPGPQKVNQIWGLNTCRLNYSVGAPPTSNAVLGQGVPQSELDLMTSAIVPTSTPTGMTTAQGMAMHIVGNAEKDGAVLAIDWGFSSRIRFSDCRRLVDGKLEEHLPLVGGQTTTVNILVDPRQLFRASPPSMGSTFIADTGCDSDSDCDAAQLPDASVPTSSDDPSASTSVPLMQLMASADQITGNANGHISIDELAKVQMPADVKALATIPGASLNLAEVLRQASYPSTFIYGDGGQCTTDVRQGSGRGGHLD
jgi:hypothetical protein